MDCRLFFSLSTGLLFELEMISVVFALNFLWLEKCCVISQSQAEISFSLRSTCQNRQSAFYLSPIPDWLKASSLWDVDWFFDPLKTTVITLTFHIVITLFIVLQKYLMLDKCIGLKMITLAYSQIKHVSEFKRTRKSTLTTGNELY